MGCGHNWSDWEPIAFNLGGGERRDCSNCGLMQQRPPDARTCLVLHSWSIWSVHESMFGATRRQRYCQYCGLVETVTQGGAVDCQHEWSEVRRATKGWFSDDREYRECSRCHLKVWRAKDGTWPERPSRGVA